MTTIHPHPQYSLDEHSHHFACWAAGRASAVKGQRFPVSMARECMGSIGLDTSLGFLATIRKAQAFDDWHNEASSHLIRAFQGKTYGISHGVAAKLINVYLKSRVVIPHPELEVTSWIHPPIDRLLLEQMALELPNHKAQLASLKKRAWSKWSAQDYREAIGLIQRIAQEHDLDALWKIEFWWKGYQ